MLIRRTVSCKTNEDNMCENIIEIDILNAVTCLLLAKLTPSTSMLNNSSSAIFQYHTVPRQAIMYLINEVRNVKNNKVLK